MIALDWIILAALVFLFLFDDDKPRNGSDDGSPCP